MRGRFASATLAALAAASLAAGCGGQGQTGAQTKLLVTRDFGTTAVAVEKPVPVTPGLTAMRQLQAHNEVETAYGGRFVNAIDGLKGGGGQDWLFYVDGVDSDKAATEVRLSGGETVQWDYHPWQSVELTGAIVGAYPEPMLSRGVDLRCVDPSDAACETVSKSLEEDGVDLEKKSDNRVVIHVGEWKKLRGNKGIPDISRMPTESGVFASIVGNPGVLKLADSDGALSMTTGYLAGLLFAYSDGDDVGWVVTAPTAEGVTAAAELLNPALLQSRFALATNASMALPLPLTNSGEDASR